MKKYENPSNFPSVIDPLIFFQDIDIPHRAAYDEFRFYLKNKMFTEATNYINSIEDMDGYCAGLYNLINKRIENLQYFLINSCTRAIFSITEPASDDVRLHRNIMWFNCTVTGQSSSTEKKVNEIIVDQKVLRRCTGVNDSGYTMDKFIFYRAYTDIYLTNGKNLRTMISSLISAYPVWFGNKTYKVPKHKTMIVIVDETSRLIKTRSGALLKTKDRKNIKTKDVQNFNEYFDSLFNDVLVTDEGAALLTKSGKYLGFREADVLYTIDGNILYTSDDKAIAPNKLDVLHTANGDILLTADGKGIRPVTLGDDSESLRILAYSISGKLLGEYIEDVSDPVQTSANITIPTPPSNVAHAKFRLLQDKSSMLWHRISFIGNSTNVYVNKNTTLESFLNPYVSREENNFTSLLNAARSLNKNFKNYSLTQIKDEIPSINSSIIAKINQQTQAEGIEPLEDNAYVEGIGIFIRYPMFDRVLSVIKEMAGKHNISISGEFTLNEAISVLNQIAVN